MSAALAFQLDALPAPPSRPLVGPWLDALWEHFRNYREGREALVPVAYMCLELLEASAPGRRRTTAEFYGLDAKTLDRLGKLTATSDPVQGSKIVGTVPAQLTQGEMREIESFLVESVSSSGLHSGLVERRDGNGGSWPVVSLGRPSTVPLAVWNAVEVRLETLSDQ